MLDQGHNIQTQADTHALLWEDSEPEREAGSPGQAGAVSAVHCQELAYL